MAVSTSGAASWSSLQKIAFRFCFLFFIFYILFNPNGAVPFVDGLFVYYVTPFHSLIPWLAKNALHLGRPVTVFTNGSGDTTYDYLIILFIAVTSALITTIWSVTGRKTANYEKLFYWLMVIVRYYVAATMVTYGTIKVIKLQFPSPSLSRLLEPVGNMSPMGLAWTYMGYSTGFNYFTGFAELSCGLLLFFRKTTTIGAIAGLAVTANIMAVNYCFDVPVKLLSTFLVLMCLLVLARDIPWLINIFFKNSNILLPSIQPPHRFKAKWKNITLTIIKYVLIFNVLLEAALGAIRGEATYGENAKKPTLYGLYKVKVFVRNRDTVAPLITDTLRWNKLVISDSYGGQVYFMNDSSKYYRFTTDTVKHEIVINTAEDTLSVYTLKYALNKSGLFTLTGNWKKDSLYISFQRFDEKSFPLIKRGFHWVNEYPFNR